MGLVVWKLNACWSLELETIRAVPANDARAFNSCLTRLWPSRVSAAYSCCSHGSYHLSFCGLKHVWQKGWGKVSVNQGIFLGLFLNNKFPLHEARTGKSRKEVSFVNVTPKGLCPSAYLMCSLARVFTLHVFPSILPSVVPVDERLVPDTLPEPTWEWKHIWLSNT